MKLGIIGLGYVGETIYKALKVESKHKKIELEILRNDPPKGFNTPYENFTDCDGIFVCVPSPMNEDGSADVSILKKVLAELSRVNYTNVIISKVTAPPDVYKELHQKYNNLVHVPEFLTAYNAFFDYTMHDITIVGGESPYVEIAKSIVDISKAKTNESIYCSIVDASVIKYAINSFLAMKVIYFNEIYELTEKAGANWSKVRRGIASDKRIGDSHTFVPGSDGLRGFGGLCFPKDTAAFLHYAEQIESAMSVLRAACERNKDIRT